MLIIFIHNKIWHLPSPSARHSIGMIETISFVLFLFFFFVVVVCVSLSVVFWCAFNSSTNHTIVLNSLNDISSVLSRYTHKMDECDEFVGVIGQISTTLQLETLSLFKCTTPTQLNRQTNGCCMAELMRSKSCSDNKSLAKILFWHEDKNNARNTYQTKTWKLGQSVCVCRMWSFRLVPLLSRWPYGAGVAFA